MSKIAVTIMEMEHHFLYLPIYFARQMNYFGELPADYITSVEQAASATDADAYKRLSRGEAQIAVCDPCAMIYAAQPDFVPVVLAGLVVRGAFWAVNTHSPEVTELDELAQFSHIVAFHPGTTSYGIAQRIVRAAPSGATPVIESVRPLQELTKLEDLVRDKKSAVALSPDVLRIEASKEANQDWLDVKLALAETTEYGHLLVTAVLARPEFVRDHPAFVSGFLRALQRSLIYTRAGHPRVLNYASEAFNRPQNVVRKALTRASDAQVWAASVVVSEDLWLTAVHAHNDSIGQPFDAAAKQQAKKHFSQSFKGQIAASQDAAVALCETKHAPPPEKWKTPALVVGGIVVGLCSLLAWDGHPFAQLPLALCVACLPTVSNFKRRRSLIRWNSLLFGLFVLLWIVHWKAHWASDEAYMGTVIVLVPLFAEANFRVIFRKREDGD
jgi:hypothetical protein